MLGINAEAWLTEHHRSHRELIEAASWLRREAPVAIEPASRPAPAASSELVCC